MSILIFLLVLFVLILVHEWGHFIVAKKTGMRVDEFGIGFPPKLFGIKKGETEYSFNSLPIGGFVRIWGENGSEEANDLPEAERARAFDARPKWAQALVLIAGVTMNVLFAWLLFFVVLLIGIPSPVYENFNLPAKPLYVAETIPNSPAAVLPTGSIIESFSYENISVDKPTANNFREAIIVTGSSPIDITYVHQNQRETVSIIPTQGMSELDPERYTVGILFDTNIIHVSFTEAVLYSLLATWEGLGMILTGLSTLFGQAVTGNADFSDVAGPVGIVGMVGDAASVGITALLTFTAVISLNLAIINLLPIPALDGGRLVFVAIEAITRRPIPPQWAGRVNFAGFALLMLLMVAVTYNDILRLLA